MKILKNEDNIIYDSMIIIYYCFNNKNHKIIEFTKKSHKLTEFLIDNNSKIVVPSFLISEIKRKDLLQMIDEYISSKQISNMPNELNITFKLGLEFKFKTKLNQLLKKEWFVVEEYVPPKNLFNPIQDFFESLFNHEKYYEFLKKKKRNNPVPSFEDIGLMAFSKDKEYPIISNDNDFTFFGEELFRNGLTGKIFNFNDLDIYNN